MFGLFSKKKLLAKLDTLWNKSLENDLWIMSHTDPGDERLRLLEAEKSYRQAIFDVFRIFGVSKL